MLWVTNGIEVGSDLTLQGVPALPTFPGEEG